MGFLSLLFLILSLRGNLILVTIFSTFVVAFCMEAAQYWYLAKGEMETANQLMTGAAIFFLINCMAGWYEFVVVLLQTNDFPWEPPMVGGAFDSLAVVEYTNVAMFRAISRDLSQVAPKRNACANATVPEPVNGRRRT